MKYQDNDIMVEVCDCLIEVQPLFIESTLQLLDAVPK